jgi:hypothetical protein
LDNFLLSSTFYTCVKSLSVIHEVMNLSDHEPIVLHLELDVKRIGVSRKVYTLVFHGQKPQTRTSLATEIY